jgi:arylsulfatase A-like enzyme
MLLAQRNSGFFRILVFASWLGLSAGLLEVLAKFACAAVGWHGHFTYLDRLFVCLVPLTDLLIFLAFGLILAPLAWLWPRLGDWLGTRWLGALSLVPVLLVVFPEVSPVSWFVLAWGVVVWVVPLAERRSAALRRWILFSTPAMAVLVLASAAWILGSDRIKQSREDARPLPPGGSPNVLLVVLDTLRADRLSLYGYERKTSPLLELLASDGVRFDAARTTAPWTLPAHGSIMTGKLPSQMGAQFVKPLDLKSPTLAEYLGSHGYSTAGFVGNVFYCSRETGLATGFTHYEDYELQTLDVLLMTRLGENALTGCFWLIAWVRSTLHSDALAPLERFVQKSIIQSDIYLPIRRKNAATINRAFLNWLSGRRDRQRPFFAFLNYFDTHTPYYPPHRGVPPFGPRPSTAADRDVLFDWANLDQSKLPMRYHVLAQNGYDEAILYLDGRLLQLFLALENQGDLDNTLVIVTADHGEGFGEHGVWTHARSLYLPEIHVPLILLPQRSRPLRGVVTEPVSLSDIPATIVDFAGLSSGSPFGGNSLALRVEGNGPDAPIVSELCEPDPEDQLQKRSLSLLGPLTSLERGRFRYIHRGEKIKEELYDVMADPGELHDLSTDPSMQPTLQQFRRDLATVLETR